ncbi:LytR/AlgR family response regulator transcription factor [Massilia glaciei]|uniref:DNA-binding response regulator n=1 Tax=Massilia glaciei TaxID=1524097 RepID=A0A2U2HME6_9BURK|nr:LytTR family transcriptional regulator DNA-binding domain-containing protein [Massilia glaciei]PWF48691.1 DNA-binding response regulator [Massilia glaciei]
MRVIIVDDEELARAVLREYLGSHADISIVAECANGFEAVKAIAELAPDLVFIDIQMPKLNGFEVVELAGSKTRYVFVTAFDQYAIKAFEIHAVDYLLKPFSQQRLDEALAHARTQLGNASALEAVVRATALRNKPLERVLIRDGARVHVIAAASIAYIEAQDDYVQIRSDGKSYLKNQPLSELESQLDPAVFLRIHRSYLLNIACIRRIEPSGKDSHTAVLLDDTRIPISRSGYQKVKSIIQ